MIINIADVICACINMTPYRHHQIYGHLHDLLFLVKQFTVWTLSPLHTVPYYTCCCTFYSPASSTLMEESSELPCWTSPALMPTEAMSSFSTQTSLAPPEPLYHTAESEFTSLPACLSGHGSSLSHGHGRPTPSYRHSPGQ